MLPKLSVSKTRSVFISCIILYQKVLSPDHSFWGKTFFPYGFCRYYPTCSEYARETFEKCTVVKALYYSCRRLMRCHPWSSGGFDYTQSEKK